MANVNFGGDDTRRVDDRAEFERLYATNAPIVSYVQSLSAGELERLAHALNYMGEPPLNLKNITNLDVGIPIIDAIAKSTGEISKAQRDQLEQLIG